MSRRLFEEVAGSLAYAQFRPRPPKELIDYVVNYVRAKPLEGGLLATAIDVGCGTGQATSLLAPHFNQVVGYDVSQSQINEAITANKSDNVRYAISPAEILAHEDKSLDLVFCSQAFHWLDASKFFKEANRVLKTNGVLAVSVYEMPYTFLAAEENVRPEVKNLVRTTYRSPLLKKHWASVERDLVDSAYSGITLPLTDFHRKDDFYQMFQASGQNILGYIRSWSGYNLLHANEPDKAIMLVDKFKADVLHVSGQDLDSSRFDIKFDFHLLIARK